MSHTQFLAIIHVGIMHSVYWSTYIATIGGDTHHEYAAQGSLVLETTPDNGTAWSD